MIDNPVSMRINLRVFGVVGVVLKFGYIINQPKNLKGKG